MFLKSYSKTFDIGNGQEVTIETGKLARQANGSCLVKVGKAVMLATVVSNQEMRDGANFFPLSVDYQEKFAGAGRIPGGFLKREGRLSEYEILISRLVDRALRPLFPDGYYYDTQVIITLLSADPEVQTDALAALAASTAITLSDLPFDGPISEVRVARINGEFVANPTRSQMADVDIDLIVAATADNIMMVEGEMAEVSETEMLEAIKFAHEAIKIQIDAQLELAKMAGISDEKREAPVAPENEEIEAQVKSFIGTKVRDIAAGALDKKQRKEALKTLKEDLKAHLQGEEEELDPEVASFVSYYFSKIEKSEIREFVMDTRKRLDGRDLDEVRPLHIEVDVLPSPHGCALFTRGETQSITTVTLGTKQDEKMLDKALGLEYRKFMLHYNFPPFSTGEAKPLRGTSRREVGHGNLAMRSLERVLPHRDENPYTIRVVSDILESNGSSSMATVCAGSLALMDAGVPVKGGVSGIAMGMISDKNDPSRYAILSDILGDEDHLGDMDFKVTGTKDGICACQMDIKVDGLSYEILGEALEQARKGRLHILNKMNEVIEAPREDYKDHTPRIEKIIIPSEFIGAIIGPGGKHIQELQKETETQIFIEEVDDKGEVLVYSNDKASIEAAKAKIKGIVAMPEVGEVYESTVRSIMPYGAFVEFLPGKQGLLHISEISWKRLENLNGIMKEGDKVKVKLLGIDQRSGKFKLSRKVLLPRPERKD